MRKVNVGLIGLGTVGSGVVEILSRHGEDFTHRLGVDLEIVKYADKDGERAKALGIPAERFGPDAAFVLDDPDVDVVIELIGGTGVARDVVLDALGKGKSVVTANKALMASHGKEVLDAAAAAGVDVAFEASVGGGIPIIGPLKHSLISNEITSVMGIVNGTTNYILTRMAADGMDYDEALAKAQDMGYAEADPSADVDGLDSGAKIAILASIAFNSRVTAGQVPTEGIRTIKPIDIEYAAEMGYAIKLLAIARRTGDGVDVRTHPTMIPFAHPLANVDGVYNAIYVVGDSVGETMFFGEGAGSHPAASAVVGDVIEVARHIQSGCLGVVGCTCHDHLEVRDIGSLRSSYYFRLRVKDRPGVLAATASVLGEHDVSISSVIQKTTYSSGDAEIVFLTYEAGEADVRRALDAISALDVVAEIGAVVRVEEL
jgi:homoserine dehydrogenase